MTAEDKTVVVWDVGNVLIEWRPERYYDRRIGREARERFFAEVPIEAANLAVDAGAPFPDAIRDLKREHREWAEAIDMWCDDWLTICAPPIYWSVRILRALTKRGVPCHALTNFGAETWRTARAEYDFLGWFDGTTVSAHLGAVKPDAAIYEAVEYATERKGGDLIFTDDRKDNIAAAEDRGWRTHLFEGPDGWAERLVEAGLLTSAEAS